MATTKSGVYYPTPLDSTCVLWWDFDDNYPNVIDKSSYHNNGTVKGAGEPPFVVGLDGMAANFDGSDDYIVSGSNIGISGETNRTVMFWAKVASNQTTKYFFAWGNDAWYERYSLLANGTNALRVDLDKTLVDFTFTYADSQWHRYAVVLDGANGSDIILYADATTPTPSVTEDHALTTINSVLRIGEDEAGANNIAAQIARFRVFNRALSAQEIKDEYDKFRR